MSWSFRPVRPHPIEISSLAWARYFASVGSDLDFLKSVVVYLIEESAATDTHRPPAVPVGVGGCTLLVLGSYYNRFLDNRPFARTVKIIAQCRYVLRKVLFRLKLRISRIKWQCVPYSLTDGGCALSLLDNWTIKYSRLSIGGGNHTQTAADLIYFGWVGNSPKQQTKTKGTTRIKSEKALA